MRIDPRWFVVAVAWLPFAAMGAMPPDAATGRWKTQVHDGVVQIGPCGTSICGRIVTSALIAANPDLSDSHNADPALRPRRLVGLTILQGFTFDDGAWLGGTIYNPADGRNYHARVTVVDRDHLRVRGCVFVPLCQTQVWTRVR